MLRPGAASAAAFLVLLAGCGGAERGTAPPPVPASSPAGAAAGAGAAPSGGAGYAAGPVADGGRIHGRVIYRGAPPPPAAIEPTKDRAVCGATRHTAETLVVGAGGALRYAVVSIDPIASGKPFAAERQALDQHGCWFVPHVLVVPAGAPFDIVNSDGILHNIHTFPRRNPAINMAQPKFKKILTHTLDLPETVRVACDVHAWMSAWIVAAAHPYTTVTGADGSFALDDVPAGSYTLGVWHETLGTRTRPVALAAGGAQDVEVVFE